MRRNSTSLLPLFAAGLTVTLWASAFVGIRSAREALGAGPLALLRLVVGSLALGAFLMLRRGGFPARKALPGIAVCGVLWFGVYNLALNEAEGRVDAGTAAMLVNVAPILIAVLAGFLLREGYPSRLLIGCLIAFSGVVVIGFSTGRAGINWGASLCLLAAACYAIALIVQKPTLTKATPLQITWLSCTIGAIVCLPFAPALIHDLSVAPMSGIGWAIYLGLVPTAIGFATWVYALAHMKVGTLAVSTYLVPPLTILLSWILLDQVPSLIALLGGLVCLVGVAMSRSRQVSDRSATPLRRPLWRAVRRAG